MSVSELGGVLFTIGLLACLARLLVRMQPRRRPYLVLALMLALVDVGLRLVSVRQFEPGVVTGFTHELNRAERTSEDLDWPNRIVFFALTTLALWVAVRPPARSRLAGIGAALVVPGGLLNLAEPLLFGYTTDYLAVRDLVVNLADIALVAGLPMLAAGVLAAELAARRRRPRPTSL